MSKNKALFLDRDGVINIDYGHVYKISDFHFIERIFDLCKAAQQEDYLIIVVTNQAGIAKGYYTEEDFVKLNDYMISEFERNNIIISKSFFCPYHEKAIVKKYTKSSFDRKPNPGMILKAVQEFDIDVRKSILIGDKETDIEAAINAKIHKKILFNSLDSKTMADIKIEKFTQENIRYIFGK